MSGRKKYRGKKKTNKKREKGGGSNKIFLFFYDAVSGKMKTKAWWPENGGLCDAVGRLASLMNAAWGSSEKAPGLQRFSYQYPP